ncbi:MAG: hypothetical protein J3Q66DRAFT_49698 [Benniella sp.]|nr:MAG: hypothetical protein J3Q66DRAFT_49698 [Benniella sp.]
MSAILRTITLYSRTSLLRPAPTPSVHNNTILHPFTERRTWTIHPFSTKLSRSPVLEKKAPRRRTPKPKDPYLLSRDVMRLAKKGKLNDAIALVADTPKSRQSEVVWNHLIQESSKLSKGNQSWSLFSDMKKSGFEPSERTYTILLNAMAINTSSPNSVSRARALYQQMQNSEDTPPSVTHTNALLKVCARKPDYKALQEVYESMPKSGPNAPDVVTFNIVINSLARMGGDQGFEKAWKVWEDCVAAKMKRPDEVDLDPSLVDAILFACREAKSVSLAKRGRRIVESLYGLNLPLSESTETTSSTGAGSMSMTERAISPSKGLGLGPILQKETIRPRTVELLLAIHTKFKDYDKAEKLLDLVRTTFPDFKPDSQLLSSVIHLQIIRKHYGKAIQTWDEINTLGLQHTPATFKQGLDASLKDRNWEKTWEMYTEMKKLIAKNKGAHAEFHRPYNSIVHQQDAWTLVSTVKCAVKTKHIAEAVEILQESKWVKVVQNPQYPRANADLADLAVKVYTLALHLTKSPKDNKPLIIRGVPGQTDPLEKELQKAKDIRVALKDKLAKHDAEQEMDEDEEEEEEEEEAYNKTHTRRLPTTLVAQSSYKKDEGKTGSGWRKVTMDEGRDDYKQRYRAPRSSSRQSKANSSSPRGPRGSQSGKKQFETAFQPSRTFTRQVF